MGGFGESLRRPHPPPPRPRASRGPVRLLYPRPPTRSLRPPTPRVGVGRTPPPPLKSSLIPMGRWRRRCPWRWAGRVLWIPPRRWGPSSASGSTQGRLCHTPQMSVFVPARKERGGGGTMIFVHAEWIFLPVHFTPQTLPPAAIGDPFVPQRPSVGPFLAGDGD